MTLSTATANLADENHIATGEPGAASRWQASQQKMGERSQKMNIHGKSFK